MHGMFCRDHPDVRLVREGRTWRHADGRWCASSWPVYRRECRVCEGSGNDILRLVGGVLTCRHCHTPVQLPMPVLEEQHLLNRPDARRPIDQVSRLGRDR
jgi:hypothetical protein